jgi:hypothetical protein
MNISFDHWEDAKYGNPDTHYTNTKIKPKFERSNILCETLSNRFGSFSTICEFGCNNGRNLYPFYNAGYEVFGYDICTKAIDSCKEGMEDCADKFKSLDLFNDHGKLSSLDDNFFDVSFTMGFLMHLPKHKNKEELVKQIIRVSKNVVIYEYNDGNLREEPGEDGWHLSAMNYGDYDERIVEIPVFHKEPENRTFRIHILQKLEVSK